MADIADVRQALAAALTVIPGVHAHAYNLDNPTFPSLVVLGHDEIDYGDAGFGRHDTMWNLIVRGYVSTSLNLAAQQLLDRFLASDGTYSVKAAVEADQTLGGLVDWALVIRATGSNTFQLPNTVSALGTDFTVQIHTSD